MDRLHLFKCELLLFAPGRKLRDGDEIRAARVPVPDVGCKEFPESFAGLFGAEKNRRPVAGGGSDSGPLPAGDGHEIAKMVRRGSHGFDI